jgi:glycosyltransferase involved in cell wall biosynthesis
MRWRDKLKFQIPPAVDIEIVALKGWNPPPPSIVKRHVNYSKMLYEKTGGLSRLTILTQKGNGEFISNQDLKFTPLKKLFPNFLNYFNFLFYVSIFKSKVFIFPDPFLYSSLYSVLPRKSPFQVQCHGDFGDQFWKHMSLKHFILSYMAKVSLKQASQVRCVGKTQARKIIELYNLDPANVIVVPIPTVDMAVLPRWSKPGTSEVVFLGRLHQERDLEFWAAVAKEIYAKSADVAFLIIGDGTGRKRFAQLLSKIPDQNVTFIGKLDNLEALSRLAKSSVLLSTAPLESYGMALVEGAKIGIPIVSRPTAGALDLSVNYDSIFLGSTVEEISDLVLNSLKIEKIGVISASGYLATEVEATGELVDAWIKLL